MTPSPSLSFGGRSPPSHHTTSRLSPSRTSQIPPAARLARLEAARRDAERFEHARKEAEEAARLESVARQAEEMGREAAAREATEASLARQAEDEARQAKAQEAEAATRQALVREAEAAARREAEVAARREIEAVGRREAAAAARREAEAAARREAEAERIEELCMDVARTEVERAEAARAGAARAEMERMEAARVEAARLEDARAEVVQMEEALVRLAVSHERALVGVQVQAATAVEQEAQRLARQLRQSGMERQAALREGEEAARRLQQQMRSVREAARAELQTALDAAAARHADNLSAELRAREESVRREEAAAQEEAVAMVQREMEGALYRTAAAHERAAISLGQAEAGLIRQEAGLAQRDAVIASLSAELAERREAMGTAARFAGSGRADLQPRVASCPPPLPCGPSDMSRPTHQLTHQPTLSLPAPPPIPAASRAAGRTPARSPTQPPRLSTDVAQAQAPLNSLSPFARLQLQTPRAVPARAHHQPPAGAANRAANRAANTPDGHHCCSPGPVAVGDNGWAGGGSAEGWEDAMGWGGATEGWGGTEGRAGGKGAAEGLESGEGTSARLGLRVLSDELRETERGVAAVCTAAALAEHALGRAGQAEALAEARGAELEQLRGALAAAQRAHAALLEGEQRRRAEEDAAAARAHRGTREDRANRCRAASTEQELGEMRERLAAVVRMVGGIHEWLDGVLVHDTTNAAALGATVQLAMGKRDLPALRGVHSALSSLATRLSFVCDELQRERKQASTHEKRSAEQAEETHALETRAVQLRGRCEKLEAEAEARSRQLAVAIAQTEQLARELSSVRQEHDQAANELEGRRHLGLAVAVQLSDALRRSGLVARDAPLLCDPVHHSWPWPRVEACLSQLAAHVSYYWAVQQRDAQAAKVHLEEMRKRMAEKDSALQRASGVAASLRRWSAAQPQAAAVWPTGVRGGAARSDAD